MIKNYKISDFRTDFIVGIVITLVSIPISMGYALVAGLPVIYGLYGSLFPIIAFAFITSSPRYIFGVDAAPAALTGGILASLGIVSESKEALQIVPVITLLTAIWLFIFFISGADRIIKFISEPVMGGFITGIGMTIILMQIPKLFGGDGGRGELILLTVHIIEESEKFNGLSFVLGVATVAIILIFRKIMPKCPMAAIMMIVGACLTKFFHVEDYGVKLLPHVSAGLPKLVIPNMSLLYGNFRTILFPSFTIAIVIFSETLLATQNFALKYDDKINNRREILAYATGNLIAAFLGCCPVNGSVSRTGIVNQYGVKSQVASVVAGIGMIFVLLFGTPLIELLPVPILTAIVISALIGTFEFGLAHKLRKIDKAEFLIFYAAFFSVLFFGTIYGVLVGIILSATTFIIRSARPNTTILGTIENDDFFYSLKRNMRAKALKNTLIYRFTGALFYANIKQFQDEIEENVKSDTKTIIVDASGIGFIDVTAAERLLILYEKYEKKGIKFILAGHSASLNDSLRMFGAKKLITNGGVATTIERALKSVGITYPYELEEDEDGFETPLWQSNGIKNIAEFEWAFGDDAWERLNEIAEEIVVDIIGNSEYEFENILKTEKNSSHGYWSKIDEDEFLYILEQHIMIHLALGDDINNREALEQKLLERHLYLEEILQSRGEEFLQEVLRMRAQRDAYFETHHPEAYVLLEKQRIKYRELLKKRNPELEKKIFGKKSRYNK